MADFPSLVPSARVFTPGSFPHEPHTVMDGSEVRVRSSSVVIDARLSLTFDLLASSDAMDVLSHYQGQLGGFLSFAIPAELTTGIAAASDITTAGHRWLYLQPPTAEDVAMDGASPGSFYTVSVQLGSVPPENQTAPPARFIANTTFAPGRPIIPLTLTALGKYAPGIAS